MFFAIASFSFPARLEYAVSSVVKFEAAVFDSKLETNAGDAVIDAELQAGGDSLVGDPFDPLDVIAVHAPLFNVLPDRLLYSRETRCVGVAFSTT